MMKPPQSSPVVVAMRPAVMLTSFASLEVPAQGNMLGRAHLFSCRDVAGDLDYGTHWNRVHEAHSNLHCSAPSLSRHLEAAQPTGSASLRRMLCCPPSQMVWNVCLVPADSFGMG